MNQPNSDLILAAVLAGPNPLDCRLRPDGSMCVIDSAGRKLFFSPNQVAQAAARLAAQRAVSNADKHTSNMDKPASNTSPKGFNDLRQGSAIFAPPSEASGVNPPNPPNPTPKPSVSPKTVAPDATPTKPAPSPTPKPKSAK